MKWSDLKNTPVISVVDASQLGYVDDAYLDPSGQSVIGFSIRRGGLVTRHSATVWADIQALGADALTVRDASALNDPKRFSDLGHTIMAEDIRKSSVVTEGGDKVGSIGDLIFSDDARSVTDLLLAEGLFQRLRGNEHTIPMSVVRSVSNELVMVDNGAVSSVDAPAEDPA